MSSSCSINMRVPQGKVRSLQVFLVYINVLAEVLKNSKATFSLTTPQSIARQLLLPSYSYIHLNEDLKTVKKLMETKKLT